MLVAAFGSFALGSFALGSFALGRCASEAAADAPPGWLESYAVHATCPSEASFRRQVEARLANAPGALARVHVSVGISRQISAEPGALEPRAAWHAVLSLTDLDRHTATHEVSDPSCDALVRALGLLVALSVDAAPDAAPDAQPAPEPLAAASAGTAPVEVDAAPASGVVRPEGEAYRVGAAVLAGVRGAVGPEPTLGLGIGASLEWGGDGPWAPRLELSGARFESREVPLARDVAMRFAVLLASASACPMRLLGTGDWALRPCLDVEVGQLTGRGSGRAVLRAEPRRTPWLATGVSLRGSLVPFGGPVQLTSSVGASLPLFRHEFVFAPDIAGFVVPSVSWNAGGALAWSF